MVAAPFTPFHSDGGINLDRIDKLAEHLHRTGVRGAFVCGTTGEGASLTVEERMAVAARWVAVAGRDLAVVVHTGHNCLADTRSLAGHAQKIGAVATAAMSPSFFKPAGVGELVDCCAQAASAAPALPFYYYHIPSMTGVNIAVTDFLRAASSINNLAGVKFTHENLMDYSTAVSYDNGRYDILFGRDEILLSGLLAGAGGAVGSTYNYSAAVYLRVMEAVKEGDLVTARKEQARAVSFIELLIRYGGLIAGKAKMKMIGIDCGPARLPLRSLNDANYENLRRDLDAIGFFQSI